MTIAPQIVHTCDHVVEGYEKIPGSVLVTRTNDETDVILYDAKIMQIFSVSKIIDGIEVYFYRDNHYRLIGNRIQWLGITDKEPQPGEKYTIECFYIKPVLEEFTADNCERCAGQGWFVSLFDDAEFKVNIIGKQSKFTQEYLKALYTYTMEDEDYGTNLTDYAGTVNSDPNQIISEVTNILHTAANQYMRNQSMYMSKIGDLEDEEILDTIEIVSMKYYPDEGKLYALVHLVSAAGTISVVGLEL